MLDIHATRRCPHGKLCDDYCQTCEIDDAFEAVVEADRRLLTPRQQLWMAFNAGAQFALNHVAPPKTEPPCFAHKNDGVFYVCRCPKCRMAAMIAGRKQTICDECAEQKCACGNWAGGDKFYCHLAPPRGGCECECHK